ncbi:MAG TPA: hypothetical protein DIU15_08165 [Deltaproteobacteria bacterium]|nr:hypothetical protein [Deltaproteobacteria bacterium]HCP45999.1 hypothetical protein [Deltaproteobacteria bacterium]
MRPALTVLLLHEDEERRSSHLCLINRLGHFGVGVPGAEEARTRPGKEAPAILLFSARCWKDGGPQLVARLVDRGQQPRVLVVGTKRALRKSAEMAEEGVQGMLLEPLSEVELSLAIDEVMGQEPAQVTVEDDTVRRRARGRKVTPVQVTPDKDDSRGATTVADAASSQIKHQARRDDSPIREQVVDLAQKLRRGGARVSNISPVAMELQGLCADGPPNLQALIEKVEQDPNLAAATLRSANSVAYRGMPQVLDLRAAGRRLGSRRLGELAQMESVKSAYTVKGKGWSKLMTSMWRNTVLTAHASRQLAEWLEDPNASEVYSMALLHNIGEVLIVDLHRRMENEPPTDGFADGSLAHDMEAHHGALGALLLKSWKFPPSLVSIAYYHHDPSQLPHGTPLARHAWMIAGCYKAIVGGGATYRTEHSDAPDLQLAAMALGAKVEDFRKAASAAAAWWKSLED